MEFTKEQWNQEKRRRLEEDDQFKFKPSPSGGFQKGICPNCGNSSVWVSAGLKTVKCNHKKSCGWESEVKKLYPDMYKSLCQQYAADPQDPLGQAKVYLAQRGFDSSLVTGWFTQESAYCKSDERYYPTVRFYLDKQANIYWERFIDCNQKHKANFHGKYKGMGWVPPGLDLSICSKHQVWIVEGVFDAISLCQNWVPAIATMSSNNIPDLVLEEFKGKEIEWVIGFDNDPVNPNTGKSAGIEAAKRLKQILDEMGESCRVAFPPYRKDWNDLHREKALTPETIEKAFWRGNLLLASSPEEYGWYLSKKYNHIQVFEFGGRMYGWKPITRDADEEEPAEEDFNSVLASIRLTKISNFGLQYLYCLKNTRTKKTSYFFRIAFPNDPGSCQIELDSSEMGERGPFRKALFRESPGAMYKSDQFWLDIMTEQWFRKKSNIVNVLPWNGYDPSSRCYVFKEVAYDEKGKCYKPNQHGYFDLPDNYKVKPETEIDLHFSDQLNTDWFKDYTTCFAFNGIASLAFWTASLFAEQFRRLKKSFPFLAVVGQPGTGKSTMIEFLWKLYGRDDYEGIPLSDASTKIGFYRFMEQVANLPTVFIEDDEQKKQGKFNFEHFKASYNGRIMRVTGKATQGNETHMPKFRSSIVVGQNAKVEGSQALRERFIELFFDKSGFDQKTLEAALRIEGFETRQICGFRHYLLTRQEKIFPDLIRFYEEGLTELRKLADEKGEPLKNNRVCHTHAVVYGAARIIQTVFPGFNSEMWRRFLFRLVDLAIERQNNVAEDTPLVQLFFETVEYLEDLGEQMDHSANKAFVAVCMPEFAEICGKRQIRYFPDEQQLRRELKNSTYYKFMHSHKKVHSKHTKTKKWCFVFQKPIEKIDFQNGKMRGNEGNHKQASF